MTRIGAVTPEMMQQIVRVVTRQVLSVIQDENAPPANGIPFLNTTGGEIPAYGVFQGHDTRNITHMPALVIAKKPIDATANASSVFVNGPSAVPNNDFGFAQDGPTYQVLTDGSAAAGEGLGLTDDSFEASSGSGPFIALGEDDVRADVWLCLLQSGGGSSGRIFKTPSAGIPAAVGASFGSATCTEHTNVGVSLATTETVYNHRTSIIPGEVFVLVLAVGDRLFVWEGNCPSVISEPPEPSGPGVDDGLEGEFL